MIKVINNKGLKSGLVWMQNGIMKNCISPGFVLKTKRLCDFESVRTSHLVLPVFCCTRRQERSNHNKTLWVLGNVGFLSVLSNSRPWFEYPVLNLALRRSNQVSLVSELVKCIGEDKATSNLILQIYRSSFSLIVELWWLLRYLPELFPLQFLQRYNNSRGKKDRCQRQQIQGNFCQLILSDTLFWQRSNFQKTMHLGETSYLQKIGSELP